jgi:hypothetical protein
VCVRDCVPASDVQTSGTPLITCCKMVVAGRKNGRRRGRREALEVGGIERGGGQGLEKEEEEQDVYPLVSFAATIRSTR